MIYGYCRVSTKGQLDGSSIEDQQKKIKKYYPAAKIVTEIYSGAKERPLFTELINNCQDGDMLVVTKLDRFCRTVKEGLQYIDELMDKGVSIHILNMGLIDTSPLGRMIVTNLLAYAEFERAIIAERTQGGKAVAKLQPDYREGRPCKYTQKQKDHALELLESYSYRQVEELTGISKSTLIRHKRKYALDKEN